MVEDNEKNAKRISVVLLTRNEVHNIEACLKSCSFADEWIVVDDGSSDGTVETARRLGAKVFSRSLSGTGLTHYPYRSWKLYFNKFNTYTELSAEKYLEEGRNVSFVKDIILRPIWAFLKVYFINGGVLDGRAGFIFSINHAFYTMNKYVKYYFLKYYSGEL